MKKMIKLVALALCLTLVLIGLASCAGSGKTTIGIIQFAPHPSLDNCYEGLIEGLKEKGYVAGDKVVIDLQNAMGEPDTAQQMAKNMVAKNYNVIVGIATPAALAAYGNAQGSKTKVVFCAVSDPIGAGLVTSLEAPGLSTGSTDLLNLPAQMQMIRAFLPEAKSIGVLYTTSEPNSITHLTELKALAPEYGFEIVEQGVQSAADIPMAAAALAAKVDCINNFTDNNVVNNLSVVLEQANANGIPVFGSEIEQVKNGCLASESLDYVALGKETGLLTARVLGGEDAGKIPVSKIQDSFPCYNPEVLAKLGLTLPEAYASAQAVTADAQ